MVVLVAILSPPKYSLVEMLRLNAKWTKAYGRLSERLGRVTSPSWNTTGC